MTENILVSEGGLQTIAPGIHVIGALGNALSIVTEQGIVQIDTGSGRGMGRRILEALRTVTAAPVRTIVYSHGHFGYSQGTEAFLDEADSRGLPRPSILAHERAVARFRRYEETLGLQEHLNRLQFHVPDGKPALNPRLVHPDETFSGTILLEMGDRRIEVRSAPAETDDGIAVWLPDEGVLYPGPALTMSCPNVGTPLRTLRDAVRWAETLDELAALGPELLIPSYGSVIRGTARAHEVLSTTADALRWVRQEVVDRMNRGMTDVEIIHELRYPSDLFDRPWMRPVYGCPDYIVRDVYRSENGWWDRNPTTLHPSHPSEAARAVFEAVDDPASVLERARALADDGDVQLGLHVVDVIALAPGDEPVLEEARRLKAELLRRRASQLNSFISRNLCEVSAERLLSR